MQARYHPNPVRIVNVRSAQGSDLAISSIICLLPGTACYAATQVDLAANGTDLTLWIVSCCFPLQRFPNYELKHS